MKYEQVKRMVRLAIADWNHLYEYDWTPEKSDKRAYYLKLETCGDKRYRPDGTAYWKKCRSIVCCRCSRLWSRKQAQNLISCYPEVKTKEEFCSMTIMIGITRNIQEVFPMIRNARSRIKQLFRNKARSVKPNMFH